MDFFEKHKTKVSIFAIVLIVFFLYSAFLKPDPQRGSVVSNQVISEDSLSSGMDIISLLKDLRSIKLNGDLFDSDAFVGLVDFSLPVAQEPQGRPNPFAPVGSDPVALEGEGLDYLLENGNNSSSDNSVFIEDLVDDDVDDLVPPPPPPAF